MSALFVENSHKILPDQVLSGVAAQAKILKVASGLAWITIEGMTDDYWLCSGDTLLIAPGRLIVVQAEKYPCQIDIGPAVAIHAWTDLRTGP